MTGGTSLVQFFFSMLLLIIIGVVNDWLIHSLRVAGLEEPRNSQELLTEFIDLTKVVGPLPFSAYNT